VNRLSQGKIITALGDEFLFFYIKRLKTNINYAVKKNLYAALLYFSPVWMK